MAARSGHIGQRADDLGPHSAKHRRAAQPPDNLSALDVELGRLIRRAGRQRRLIQRTPRSSEAWPRWSASIDEGTALIARIEHLPARDLTELMVKFRAILWRIQADEGVIMDEGLPHSLRRFGRQLAKMARE